MNTLPYWYIHVANIFSCTQTQVVGDCDHYIAQLGITNKDCDAWQHKYLSRDDYPKIYNDYGTIPTVETLSKYAEWHSMFYVVGKYRQTIPISSELVRFIRIVLTTTYPELMAFGILSFEIMSP